MCLKYEIVYINCLLSQDIQMKHKDDRIKLVNEILAGIKVCKFSFTAKTQELHGFRSLLLPV